MSHTALLTVMYQSKGTEINSFDPLMHAIYNKYLNSIVYTHYRIDYNELTIMLFTIYACTRINESMLKWSKRPHDSF